MVKKEEKKRRVEDMADEGESVVAPGANFKGNIRGTAGLSVSGHMEGNINVKGLVRIEKEGKIDGTIKTPFVIIEGELNGNITNAEHVEIRSTGRVVGNVQTDKIAMAEGSFFHGEVKMSLKDQEPVSFVEKRTARAKKA